MAVQRASIERKSSALHQDFAREFVARRFGEVDAALIYSLLPSYSRGPRKGLVKGYLHWDKVTEGGWTRAGGRGHVERPGTRNVRVCASNDPDSFITIPATRRFENETDAEREKFIRDMLAEMFGKPSRLYGVIPAVLAQRATAS